MLTTEVSHFCITSTTKNYKKQKHKQKNDSFSNALALFAIGSGKEIRLCLFVGGINLEMAHL